MSRETQDAQVAKQAKEQIAFCEGADAFHRGEPIAVGQTGPFRNGWMHAALKTKEEK